MAYCNVGKLIIEDQGGEGRVNYRNKLIKEYFQKLTNKLGKGYSTRKKYMIKFYLFQKEQPMAVQLSRSHYIILLSLKSNEEINYYKKYNM